MITTLDNPRVAISRTPRCEYGDADLAETQARNAISSIADALDWSSPDRGPLGNVVGTGSRVLVKPNLVIHQNEGPWGIEPLVTHPSLVRATVRAALDAGASQVIVGDAPVQGCDFARLLSETGLDVWASDLTKAEPRFLGINDFRRTTCTFIDGVRIASEELIDEQRFVLFDLADASLLEPITDTNDSFRVTCYNPRLMAKTHSPGRHQYLVARDVIAADVVINLPKLKTHKKAGVTCALKNLIGINGNKEYLPHHRIGGSESGGDCYPGASPVKRALEYTLDRQNMASSLAGARIWRGIAKNLDRIAGLAGDQLGVEGSWAGNDTVWRTCLDLNRILLYGRLNATLAQQPQRRVIHLVDSIIAGQGDGPLAPEPLPIGAVFGGENAAAVDWVGASLLGYDPRLIPVAEHAFDKFRWPIANFDSNDVAVVGDFGEGKSEEVLAKVNARAINHPVGWRAAARSSNPHSESI